MEFLIASAALTLKEEGATFLSLSGAPLARLQLQIVLDRLSRRFPTLRLADGPDAVLWKDGLGTRGLSRLSVRW